MSTKEEDHEKEGRIQGGRRGGGDRGPQGATQICLDNARHGGGSRKLSIVVRGDHFNEMTFKARVHVNLNEI